MAYSQYASVTIDHTQCGSADDSNFTVLVSGTWAQLADLAHGGYVQNTLTRNGITVPADLIFTSDSGGATALHWDIEYWNNTTGKIVAWVLVSTVSHSTDTVFYIFVGNSGITAWQGGTQGSAYDSATVLVAHLGNGSSLNPMDWSANGWSATNTSATVDASGQIDGAATFGSGAYITYASFALGTGNLTVSAWVNTANNGDDQMIVEKDPVNGSWEMFFESGDMKVRGASGADVMSLSTGLPANNTWTQLVFTLANGASTPTGTVYSNGTSEGSNAGGNNLSDSAGNLRIGCYGAGGGYFWNGSLDEVVVANVVRGQSWITKMYNNQKSSSTFASVASFASVAGTTYTQELDAAMASWS